MPKLFEKGFSGNPGGRPKIKPLTDAYRDRLKEQLSPEHRKMFAKTWSVDLPEDVTYAQAIASVVFALALVGGLDAIKELTDRAEGKVAQEVTGNLGVEYQVVKVLEKAASVEEWERRAKSQDGGGSVN
jgi:hypothetical protein